MEEALQVGKRRVETGRVRVSVATEIVEQLVRDVLRSDHVEIDRVLVDREIAPGTAAPAVRNEAGVLIVPVLDEVLVVEKRLVLREEIRLRIVTAAEPVEQTVALRRQRAEVERLAPRGSAAAGALDESASAVPAAGIDATAADFVNRAAERE
jgi:stress response protein YsnF